MRTSLDALRSLGRHVGEAVAPLDGDWTVTTATEGGAFNRPAVTIQPSAPVVANGSVLVIDNTQAFAMNVFPEIDEEGDAYANMTTAYRLEEALKRAFVAGSVSGRAWRIALWDHDEVPADESSGHRRAQDWLRVLDFSSRLLQSPSNELAWSVNCELRLSWRSDGQQPGPEKTVRDVPLTFVSP